MSNKSESKICSSATVSCNTKYCTWFLHSSLEHVSILPIFLIQLLHSCLLTNRWQCVTTTGQTKDHMDFFLLITDDPHQCEHVQNLMLDCANAHRSEFWFDFIFFAEVLRPDLTLTCVMQCNSMFVCFSWCFVCHLTALVKVNKHVWNLNKLLLISHGCIRVQCKAVGRLHASLSRALWMVDECKKNYRLSAKWKWI